MKVLRTVLLDPEMDRKLRTVSHILRRSPADILAECVSLGLKSGKLRQAAPERRHLSKKPA